MCGDAGKDKERFGPSDYYAGYLDEVLAGVEDAPTADDAVRAALRRTDAFKRLPSLDAYLEMLRIDELRYALKERGGDAYGMRKAAVKKAILESYVWSSEALMRFALPFGPKRVRSIREIVKTGDFTCGYDLAGSDPEAFAEHVVSTYPLTLLTDVRGTFQVRVTDEAAPFLEVLTDDEWDEYERRAVGCSRARAMLPKVVDFYGVVDAVKAAEIAAMTCGVGQDSEEIGSLLEHDALSDGLTMVTVDGVRYLMVGWLASRVIEEGERSGRSGDADDWLADEVKDILAARGTDVLTPLPPRFVDEGPVARSVLLSERGYDFVRTLDDNLPEDMSDLLFPYRVGVSLVRELQRSKPGDDLGKLLYLCLEEEWQLILEDAYRERLYEVAGRLAAIVPRWSLAGSTPLAAGIMDDPERPTWFADDVYRCGDNVCRLREVDDYDEPDVYLIRRDNNVYLDDFWYWLRDKGQAAATASKHYSNVDTYLNVYLASYERVAVEEGTEYVDGYLGNFFIRKCLWSTPETIRTTATSIVKFYEYMAKRGVVDTFDVNSMKRTIKREMPEWQDTCARYNDPSEDMPFEWWEF